MLIEVLPSAGSPFLPYLQDKLVVIIDVLRATSTIVTALANGCQGVIPVLTPEEALDKRLTVPGALLGGERYALPIEGFDLGNSPVDYAPEKVGGKHVIMTTTNGTRAIRASLEAPHVWLASFLNMQSITQGIQDLFLEDRRLQGVVVFCAGTEDRFDLADILCAGMLIDYLGEDSETNDLGEAARMLFRATGENMTDVIRRSDHGRRLESLGFGRDVEYCLTPNILPIIPVLDDGEIIWLTKKARG